jgi:integrase
MRTKIQCLPQSTQAFTPSAISMRHGASNGVKMAGSACPPKIVQERLGHSSITLTMDTFGHLFPRGDDASELASAEAALLR